jgi:SH3-like domain-containing protein
MKAFHSIQLRAALVLSAAVLLSGQAWAEMRSVRAKTANFREAPSPSADVLFTAERYYPVEVLERKRGWVKAKDFEGEVAWVADRLLGPTRAVVVIVKEARVRVTPDFNAPEAFRASWSDAFPVKEVRAGWVLIETSDQRRGWISRDMVWGLALTSQPV